MRKISYHYLEEFIDEYSYGKSFSWQNEDQKERYMGIEFFYNNICYRMCREPNKDNELPRLRNGNVGKYSVTILHHWMKEYDDDDEILIGWYEDLTDVLENCKIEGRKFRDIIMDDNTIIWGKD